MEFRMLAADEVINVSNLTQNLKEDISNTDAEKFEKHSNSMTDSLGKLTEIEFEVNRVRKNWHKDFPISKESAAFKKASDAYDLILSTDKKNLKFELKEVFIGQQLDVLGADGRYYLGQLSEDLRKNIQLSVNPTYQDILVARMARGPSALYLKDRTIVLRPGRYNFWIRQADIDDIISSPDKAWFMTYEIADTETQKNLLKLKRFTNEFVNSIQKFGSELNSLTSESSPLSEMFKVAQTKSIS
jgi:hypothetical protein